ncbi:hypothetical protein GRI97_14325 [Altererythrobacter xixiisoli]|uniref:Uncharacterized protein n=1 Tax=Croceibacterium xixiisoli TaxID=1476466 RepID=A0A6I4TVD0_9SPHN|nr:hypothetical protein [Croceibacterium xixiisoli]MXP00166.1 hypothetical protein [Croceibacterium xixiisoli]
MNEDPRTIPAEPRDQDDAPELHNSEQEDEEAQAQTIADEARHGERAAPSPLDSSKSSEGGEVMDDASQDLIDLMRDMEQSGQIDMRAYRGEPNMDDEDETYGKKNADED